MKYFTKKGQVYILLLSFLVTPLTAWAGRTVVDMQTSHGLITLKLRDYMADGTVTNFLSYMDAGFYDGTVFHRVIDGFMIQGGGFDEELNALPVEEPIVLETNRGLSNVRGTIAMARRADPDSASSQFFINTVDNSFLDYQSTASPGYAVFGEVIAGMDVVDLISQEATGNAVSSLGAMKDVPTNTVVVEVIRPREGELKFADIPVTYSAGDRIVVNLVETMIREEPLDLWFAILTADSRLFYVSPAGLSLMPNSFMNAVSEDVDIHTVFNFEVPEGLVGRFTLLAIFNNPGEGIDHLEHSLRSNIARFDIELVR
ncbi:MAG: hypothetical protein GQ582_05230 [Methyloprofundus sp.]|nr:hypothetical protein [Methyloprofundus sp.]